MGFVGVDIVVVAVVDIVVEADVVVAGVDVVDMVVQTFQQDQVVLFVVAVVTYLDQAVVY